MGDTRKQITFDLDTNALKKYYPSESWNNAYEVIRKHMTANGFYWLQGSVYVSEKPMKPYRVTRILNELVNKNPWLNVCMRDCRETNIGKEYDINSIFDKTVKIQSREEVQEQKKCAFIFQEAGFRPTDTLISNMQKLNIVLGRETTLREIKELRKNKEQLPGKAKYYVEAIAKECAAEEMVIQERSLDIEP